MTIRTKIGNYYVERDSKGRIVSWIRIGKSLKSDRKTKSKRKVSSGYGHVGDRRLKRRK